MSHAPPVSTPPLTAFTDGHREVDALTLERWTRSAQDWLSPICPRVVATLLDNCAAFVVLDDALERAGVVHVPLPTFFTPQQLQHALAATGVDLLIRRPVMPLVNKTKGAGYPGMVHGYLDLPDADKWRLRRYFNRVQVPPPRGSTLRVSRHPNARFHLGAPVLAAGQHGGGVWLDTPLGRFEADMVLLATGFRSDLPNRPELAAIAPAIRLWSERYQAPADDADEELAGMPDLGPAFEFRERSPGACPGLSRVHCFCYPAMMSHGALAGDIPAISEGAQRLARGMASLLLRDAFEAHLAAVQAYDDPELLGDEWRVAQRPSTSSEGMPAMNTGPDPSAPSSAA